MTDVKLTGPDTCAQCGSELDAEAILLEALVTGTSEAVNAAYVVIRGHKVAIPGLYWDKTCSGRIESGELESGLTCKSAREFLDDVWGPQVTMAVLLADTRGNDDMAELAAGRLADVLEVSLLLEAVVELAAEPGGLDFIPECTGDCGGKHEVHPRDMAAMN
jgi:hypothetical protein